MKSFAARAASPALLMMLAVSTARAQTALAQSGERLTLFPSTDLFGVYVADPERPTNTISFRFYAHDAIPETRTPRAELGAGGRFGILRLDPGTAGARAWQLNLDAGLDALFDMQNKEDSIGWDGTYGLSVTTAKPGRFAFKFGISHTSGHLGDEYMERTGVARTNYTRQEVAFGVSRQLSPAWRAYGETGIAYVNDGPEQKPFRVQAGAEYESRPRILSNRFSWYGAGDFSVWQERNGRLDTAIQGGIVTRTDGRAYRLGIGFNDGRPPVTEFYRFSEACLIFGFWIDF